MIVDKVGLPEADPPGLGRPAEGKRLSVDPSPGDTPMLEEPRDELPIVFVSRPPLIPRVFPGL